MPKTRTIDGVRVHAITGENDPYAIAARTPGIGDGDVIVVDDWVVGVRLLGYTCAVTHAAGEFAYLDTDASPWATVAGGRYAHAYDVAAIVAGQLGSPVLRPPRAPAKRRVPARQEVRSAPVPRQAATRSAAAGKTSTRATAVSSAAEPRRASSSATAARASAPRRMPPAVPFTAADTKKG